MMTSDMMRHATAGKSSTNKSYQNALDQMNRGYNEITESLKTSYGDLMGGAGADADAYRQAVQQGGYQGYSDASPYQYDLQGMTRQLLDPSMQFQIEQATGAVEGSAANAGKLFSGATGQAIADRSQQIAQMAWKDALQTALQDRQFGYQMHSDEIARDRASIDQQNLNLDRNISNLQGLQGSSSSALNNYMSMLTQNKTGQLESQMNAYLANEKMKQDEKDSKRRMWGDILGGVGNIAGSIIPLF